MKELKINREELDVKVMALLKKNNANSQLFNKMSDELEGKLKIGMFEDIYNLNLPTNTLSIEQLYLIVKSLYDNWDLFKTKVGITKEKLNPENYFTEQEIIGAKEIKILKRDNKENVFEMHNTDEYFDEEMGLKYWICSYISYQDLVNNWERGTILYTEEMQRAGEIKTALGEKIIVPKLFSKNVDEMYELMCNHKFYPNELTLNLLENNGKESEFVDYNPETRTLRVKKTPESLIYCIDGMHRLTSARKALVKNPDLKKGFQIRLFNLDVDKAQHAINQESQGTPLDKITLAKYSPNNMYMDLAKKINIKDSEKLNSLYRKMTNNYDEVKANTKYCLFTNISIGLEENFKDVIENANSFEMGKIQAYIIDFYNTYIGVFQDKFDNLKSVKQSEVVADLNTFTGILYIARKLYKDTDWQQKFINILMNTNWSKTSELWKEVPTASQSWSKSAKEKVYGAFAKLL